MATSEGSSASVQIKYKWIFYAIFIYALLSGIFASSFYKLNLFGIHISEYIVILSILFFFKKKHFKNLKIFLLVYILFIYWVLVVVFSFVVEREGYFVLRQGSNFFYLMLIPFSAYSLAELKKNNFFNKKNDKIYLLLVLFSFLIGGALDANNRDGIIPLLIITLTLFKMRSFVLSIIITGFILTNTSHFSYQFAILVYLFAILFFKMSIENRIIFVLLLFMLSMIAILFLTTDSQISDANAVWRYLYWKDMLEYMLNFPRFFTGVGYGVPYMQTDFENYQLLTSQVQAGKDYYYQLYTVPPHNSLLAIFYHLGFFPILIFVYLYYRILINNLSNKNYFEVAALLSLLVIISTHNGLELPYIAVLCSYIIAIGISPFVAQMSKFK